MNISLRRGEKLYLNGAVIRADRKVCIELLNDVTFLLENHVMQAKDATSPLRQLYFVVQLMLMSPNDTTAASDMCRSMLASLNTAFPDPRILNGLALAGSDTTEKSNPAALSGFGVSPRKSLTLPATADLVNRLNFRSGVRVIAADLSGL